MIHHARGADDPRIAAYAGVGDHARLLARGRFVAEGRLVVERVIDSRAYDIESVLVTPAALDALRSRLEPLAADVYVADRRILNAVTGFNFHRGCLALVRRPEPSQLDTLLRARRLLVVEGVGNPDNVGGLFRAAAAFGADGLLLDSGSGDPFYRKALRTSMGAVLRVPFVRTADWPAVLRTVRAQGLRLIALTPAPSARALRDAAAAGRSGRIALMVGSESQGLSAAALAAADERVRIPIVSGVDSLNVVVAVAIALYAFAGDS